MIKFKQMTEEEISVYLYHSYGITEWREKSLVLKAEERKYILQNLDKENDMIVSCAKLPFPKFMETYCGQFYNQMSFIKHPHFGYNVYMLSDHEIKLLMKYLRKEHLEGNESALTKSILEDLQLPFDYAYKIDKNKLDKSNKMFKKAYISQYIDKKEAERMLLTDYTFYSNGEYRSFELIEKLNCLNLKTRKIFELLLGLNGRYRKKINEIAKELNISTDIIKKLIKFLDISFTKTLGEFKNKLGCIPSDDPQYFNEYRIKEFREMDYYVNIPYFIETHLSEEERQRLTDMSNLDIRLYLASNYFYQTPEKVRRSLEVSIQDANKFFNKRITASQPKDKKEEHIKSEIVISEWREKCLLLTSEEKEQIIKDLNSGITSKLASIIKLPFPNFAYEFLKDAPLASKYITHKSFGYTLYMLSDLEIVALSYIIRGKVKVSEAKKVFKIDFDYFETFKKIKKDFESINPLNKSHCRILWQYVAKYIYISQYIDKQEAERLDMKGFTYYTNGEYRGFELNEKLLSLNPGMRKIILSYIGEAGEKRLSEEEIVIQYKLSQTQVTKAITYLLPLLLKSTREMQIKIGYAGEEENSAIQYTNKDFKNFDIAVETTYIFNNLLSDEERKVLENKSQKEIVLYLAAKYMYKNEKTIYRNLYVTLDEAKKLSSIK